LCTTSLSNFNTKKINTILKIKGNQPRAGPHRWEGEKGGRPWRKTEWGAKSRKLDLIFKKIWLVSRVREKGGGAQISYFSLLPDFRLGAVLTM
jgi:hypothetical protein